MKTPPEYIYIGPGEGRGEVHVIVFNESDEVITIASGHGWMGTREEFRKQFKLR